MKDQIIRHEDLETASACLKAGARLVWDGAALHARGNVTEQDIDAMVERLEALRRVLRSRSVVPVSMSGRIIRPGEG